MVVLRCPCEHEREVWGEFWWVGGEHDWVSCDDFRRSGTCGERLTRAVPGAASGSSAVTWRRWRAGRSEPTHTVA